MNNNNSLNKDFTCSQPGYDINSANKYINLFKEAIANNIFLEKSTNIEEGKNILDQINSIDEKLNVANNIDLWIKKGELIKELLYEEYEKSDVYSEHYDGVEINNDDKIDLLSRALWACYYYAHLIEPKNFSIHLELGKILLEKFHIFQIFPKEHFLAAIELSDDVTDIIKKEIKILWASRIRRELNLTISIQNYLDDIINYKDSVVGIRDIYHDIAYEYHYSHHDYLKSIECYLKVIGLYNNNENDKNLVSISYEIGKCYYNINKYEDAINYFNIFIDIIEGNKIPLEEHTRYNIHTKLVESYLYKIMIDYKVHNSDDKYMLERISHFTVLFDSSRDIFSRNILNSIASILKDVKFIFFTRFIRIFIGLENSIDRAVLDLEEIERCYGTIDKTDLTYLLYDETNYDIWNDYIEHLEETKEYPKKNFIGEDTSCNEKLKFLKYSQNVYVEATLRDRVKANGKTVLMLYAKLSIFIENYSNEESRKLQKEEDDRIYNYKLESERNKRKEITQIISDYNHDAVNHLLPKSIKEVCGKLYKSGNTGDALLLQKAYTSELILQHQAKFMRFIYTSDAATIHKYFRNDCIPENSNQYDSSDIKAIFNEALELFLSQILSSTRDIIICCLKTYTRDLNKDINDISKDFNNKIMVPNEEESLNWTNNMFLKINLDITHSSGWENIKLKKDGYASFLFIKLFHETLLNAFKYGIIIEDKPWLEIKLSSETIKNKEYLTISSINFKRGKKNNEFSSNIGIESIERLLKHVNNSEDSLEIIDESDTFTTIMLVYKNLFINNG